MRKNRVDKLAPAILMVAFGASAADMRPGIAAKFPTDVGLPSHPAVIFADGFEKGNLTGYTDINRKRDRLRVTDELAHSGRHCLEVGYDLKDTGPWMHRRFKGVQEIYWRYYRMFPAEWKWPRGYGPHDTLVFAGKYSAPTSTDLSVYTDFWKTGETFFRIASTYQERGYGGWNEFQRLNHNRGHHRIELGKWFCVETMAKLSTPGGDDGEIRVWIDGRLITEATGLPLRDKNHPDILFDHWMLGPYFHNGTQGPQKSYLDDLVVATAYIGRMVKRAPKVARKKGDSVWKLIAEKEKARLAQDGSDADAQKLARAGDYEAAARAYEGLASKGGGDAERSLSRARALKRAGELREWVVGGVNAGKKAKTYVDVMGVRLRGKVISADERGLTVVCMGNEVGLKWEKLPPARLFSLARKFAAGEEQRELLRSLREACGLGGERGGH